MNTTTQHRIKYFKSLQNHSWYGKLFKKLKKADMIVVNEFLNMNGELEPNAYAEQVQRFFINNRSSKNWTTINELLLICAQEVPPKKARAKKQRRKKVKKAKPNTYIKKLGLEPAPKRTPKVLRQRIKTLKANLKAGKYKGNLAERAEFYLKEHVKALKAG